jgi:hypothetical protein
MLIGLDQLIEQLRILTLEAASDRSVFTLDLLGFGCGQNNGDSHALIDVNFRGKVSGNNTFILSGALWIAPMDWKIASRGLENILRAQPLH